MTIVSREPSNHALMPGETARDYNASPLLQLCPSVVTFIWMSALFVIITAAWAREKLAKVLHIL